MAAKEDCSLLLYQFPHSHYSAKVRIVLYEKGLPFEMPVFDTADLQSPAFLAINPLGKVPCLVDGDFALGESEVIVEYLEDRYPQPALLPADPQGRAQARWLSRFHDLYLGPQLSTLYFALSDGRAGQPEFVVELERFTDYFLLLERSIQPAPYFLGTEFTLADASFCLSYRYALMLAAAHARPINMADIPKLAAWFALVSQRPSVAAVLAAAEAALADR